MADKVQNVRINFITGANPDLIRAEALLTKAQQATDKLNQSTQKFNQSASSGTRQVSSTLESLILQQQRLLAQIRLTNTADTKRLADLSKQYKDLTKQIDDLNKKYIQQEKVTKTTSTATKDLGSQFSNLYNTIRLVLAAGLVREVVDISINMARLSGNVEGVERAFNRAFGNAPILLRQLRASTHGAVSDFELMQRTLQATNLGVAVESLPILFEFAATRAQQTGESVDYLVDSIVRGIGRKSILVLDNLGLSATRLKEQFNGASLASQSVADVTRGVAEIARVELEKMGGFVETSATKVDKLNVSWQQLKVTLSQRFDSSGVVSFLNEAVDGFEAFIKSADQRNKALSENAAIIEVQSLKETALNKERLKDSQELLDAIQQEINTRVQLIGRNNDEIAQLRERFKLLNETRDVRNIDEIDAIKESSKERNFNNLVLVESIKLLKAYLAEVNKSAQPDENLLGRIEEVKNQIEALQERIEKFRGSDQGLAALNQELFILQGTLHDLETLGFPDFDIKELPLKEIQNATEGIQISGDIINGKFITISDSVSNVVELIGRFEESMKRVASGEIKIPVPEFTPTDFLDRLKTEFTQAREEISETGINILADQLFAAEEAELQSLQVRMAHLREYYDEQILLAGNNERAKDELRIREERETNALRQRIAEKEKKVRRFSVILDTAAGIMRAFATAANIPQAIIQAAIVAAQGISQLAIINRTPARFAKGVIDLKGPGTTTSDSIPARLSRRESVMTADETIRAKGILTDIRAKRLDDRILANMRRPQERQVMVFNDERIITELKEIRKNQPDIVTQYGALYTVTGKGTSLQKRIRAKRISG